MRAVLAGVGSRGDFQPLLALAVALQRRGHEVSMYGVKNFARWAEREGVAFVASDTDVEQALRSITQFDSGVRAVRAAISAMRGELGCQFERLVRMAAGADVVLGMGGCIAGRSAAEAAGIPFHMVLYTPQLVPSEEYPPVLQLQRMPGWANRWGHALVSRITQLMYGRPIAKLRRGRGLPPRREPLDFLFGPEDVLLACDPEIARAPADGPLRCVELAAFTYPDTTELSADLTSFLNAGEPPIYIGFGSMEDPDAGATRAMIQSIADELAVRVVLSQRLSGDDAPEKPTSDRVYVVRSAPHPALFPRVSMAVHHGGSGTTAAAARAGLPQVTVPHYFDQFFFGERLYRAGVAPNPIARTKLSRRRLKRAIAQVLEEPRYRDAARQLGRTLRGRNGVAMAVEYLEKRYGASDTQRAAAI